MKAKRGEKCIESCSSILAIFSMEYTVPHSSATALIDERIDVRIRRSNNYILGLFGITSDAL